MVKASYCTRKLNSPATLANNNYIGERIFFFFFFFLHWQKAIFHIMKTFNHTFKSQSIFEGRKISSIHKQYNSEGLMLWHNLFWFGTSSQLGKPKLSKIVMQGLHTPISAFFALHVSRTLCPLSSIYQPHLVGFSLLFLGPCVFCRKTLHKMTAELSQKKKGWKKI